MASPFSEGINNVPNEITDMICDAAGSHYEASKSLRLTARRFYNRATVNTFSSLVVHQHPTSYEKVNQIAQSPELAPLVQILYLAREEALPDYFEVKKFLIDSGEEELCSWLEEYLTEHAGLRETIMEEEQDRREEEQDRMDYPDSDDSDDSDDDEMDVDSLFGESPFTDDLHLVSEPAPTLQETIHAYGFWWKGQQVIGHWSFEAREAQKVGHPTPQRILFEKLRGVHSLESLDRDDLVKLNRRKPQNENLDITRVEMATHSRRDGLEYTLFDQVCDNLNIELFLLDRQRCNATIANLKLRAFDEICTEPALQINFSCLRTLTIDLCDESDTKTSTTLDQLFDAQIADCTVTPWFRTITNLESLTLVQDPSNLTINLLGVLGQFQFPKLRNLTLVHIAATADTLRDFLVAHPSLVNLIIEEPVVQPRHWDQLGSEIPSLFNDVSKAKSAPVLQLTESFKPENNADFVRDAERCTIPLAGAVDIWWAEAEAFPSA